MTRPQIQPQQNPEEYRPDNLPELEVGMKVEVAISGECAAMCVSCGSTQGHFSQHGRTGEIIGDLRVNPPMSLGCGDCAANAEDPRAFGERTKHFYGVRLDYDFMGVLCFAAAELIPIPES